MTDSIEKSLVIKIASFMFAAAAVTSTALIYFYENYRVPLKELIVKSEYVQNDRESKEKYSKLEKLTQESLEKLRDSNENIQKLNHQLKEALESIELKSKKISELQAGNLFYPGNPYPVELGKLRIGDNINHIKEIYNPTALTWKDDEENTPTVTASNIHAIFKTITYDYDKQTNKISSIIFETDYDINPSLLKNKLLDALGQPIYSKAKEYAKWEISQDISSYLMSGHQYTVMNNEFVPLVWQDRRADNNTHTTK